MNSPSYSFLATGMIIWLIGTLGLRFAGQSLLKPGHMESTGLLFLVSFPLMAFLVRTICKSRGIARELWPAAGIFLVAPTLLLDPFSTLHFSTVFPNIPSDAAALFGAWMLWCCGGGLAGAVLKR
jgi:Family of unknown function (DUF5367)